MKLVDLDQTIFVPVVDESHGGAVVEMKMTVGEFFEKCCAGFAPEVVEAIPVEWLHKEREHCKTTWDIDFYEAVQLVLCEWQKEQEAR